MAYISRLLQDSERNIGALEQYITALQHCLRKLKHYLAYATGLTVEAPVSLGAAMGLSIEGIHPKLAGLLLDISFYPITKYVLNKISPSPLLEKPHCSNQLQGATITKPVKAGQPRESLDNFTYKIYFDGGCSTRQATGGFVIFRHDVELVRCGCFFRGLTTNN